MSLETQALARVRDSEVRTRDKAVAVSPQAACRLFRVAAGAAARRNATRAPVRLRPVGCPAQPRPENPGPDRQAAREGPSPSPPGQTDAAATQGPARRGRGLGDADPTVTDRDRTPAREP